MKIVTTRAELQAALEPARAAGKRIAFVPTMGYLHEGHLSLIDAARNHGDVVIMSIYVNPLQFGPSEDLARYPRDPERDGKLARARGVDFLFMPSDAEMYADPRPAVTVHAPVLSDRLCGKFRPGHFEGVLTVVAKLFNIVQPHAAVFGQKDFQQVVLIQCLVRDLSYDIEIVIAPIIRDKDGLALSSRNIYLNPAERNAALTLSRALNTARAAFRSGIRSVPELLQTARGILEDDAGIQLQYVELVDAVTLETAAEAKPTDVMAVAAMVGKTRLIDNVIIG